MGAKRKVDAKLYAKIKKSLKTPKDDAKAIKKYKLGQATIRAIRNSWCYDDYLARTKVKSRPKHSQKTSMSTQEKTFLAWYGFLALSAIGALVVAGLFIRWILSWFGI